MRLHRFFIPELVGNRTELIIRSSDLVGQLRRVLRLKIGEEAVIFDGSGSDYTAAIAQYVGADCVVFDVRGAARSRYMPSRKIYLCAALVKKDNFEFIVEKATELGVTDIIPVLAERSEKKSVNEERLNKIAVEASEQSGRGNVPVVHPVVSLKEAVELFKKEESGERGSIEMPAAVQCLVFHTDGEHLNRNGLPKDAPIALFIGPEGGWSPDEVAMFHAHDIDTVCLGSQVLRAETAVVAALSQVVFG